jgi:hypothetical protein
MVAAERVVGEGDGVNTPDILPRFAPASWIDAGAFLFKSIGECESDDRQKRAALNGG